MARGFLIGLVAGGVLGALGGTLDRGGLLIMVPSGPPFWGLLGAFAGGIVGTLGGAIFTPVSRKPSAGSAEEADSETLSRKA